MLGTAHDERPAKAVPSLEIHADRPRDVAAGLGRPRARGSARAAGHERLRRTGAAVTDIVLNEAARSPDDEAAAGLLRRPHLTDGELLRAGVPDGEHVARQDHHATIG
jgi:hypothetical protein